MVDWKTDVDWAKTALVVANLSKFLEPPLRTNIRKLIDAAEHARIPVIFVRDSIDATRLQSGLRPVGQRGVIIAGDVTDLGLEAIMREVFLLGFTCVVATDAVTVQPARTRTAESDPSVGNLAWHGRTAELVEALAEVAPVKPGLAEALAAC